MKLVTLLSLLIIYSCDKKVTISRDDFGAHIDNVTMGISHLKEIEWYVGAKRDEVVTQSFTFIVALPSVEQEDLNYLSESKGIDSWIIRVKSLQGSNEQDLGSLYTLFSPKRVGRGESTGAAQRFSVKVYYAAAYASERMRNSPCPEMKHDKRIKEMFIAGSAEKMDLAIKGAKPYPEKSQLIELTPSAFNGGNTLVGQYFLEIAPYDSKNRVIHADFKRLPQYVVVRSEEFVTVKGCE